MAWAFWILFMAVLVGGCEDEYKMCCDKMFNFITPKIICEYVNPRLINLTSSIQQLITKFNDHSCETCALALNDILVTNFNSEFAQQGRALKDLSVRVENIEKRAEKGLAKISALESTLEERFNKLSQNYEDTSQMLKKILDAVSDKAEGIANLVQKQTKKIEQQEFATQNEFRKQEARIQETAKAVTDITNRNQNLIRNYQQLERAAQKLDHVESKLKNVLKLAENAVINDQNQTRKIDALHTVILNGFEKQESNFKEASNATCENTSRIQNIVERTEAILNNVTKELGDSAPEKTWNNFVTSNNYVNFRMITFEKGYFEPKYIPKELSPLRARKDCMRSCAKNESCLAFNLYDTENYFVCEMLPDNLCVNRTKIAFAEWPGSTVWEKMSSAVEQSCVDAKFPVGRRVPCEALRPGCFGDWPQCSNCFRTCKDPYKLYKYDIREFTLWPEGDGPSVLPVFAHCLGNWLYLLRKEVDLTEARLKHNYIMPFEDMHRFWRLKTYRYIQFWFETANSDFLIDYKNWYIDASGSLTNLTYRNSDPPKLDIFDLNGQAMKSTPFIHVQEDRFGCGSFWLLDPNNATYCPGGRVSMLGEMRVERGKVVSTGMSIPQALARNEIVHYVFIKLWG